MANFLLIHGGSHGGWCWERVVPLLESQGHTVTAPDLPGLGGDRTPATAVTLQSWGRFVADLLRRQPGGTILVGHSLGGMAISQAAEYAPGQIGRLVYLAALLPQNGLSAFDLNRGDQITDKAARMEIVPTPDLQYFTISPENARAFFYGETASEWAERALSRLVPQPLAVVQAPAELSEAGFGSVPRAYIECLRDRVLPVAVQRAMHAATPCDMVLELDTDHSAFYSAPAELTKHLVKTAAEYD